MNNLKKIGLTALAGSLVAVSAQAGEMSVSGSFNATYSTQNGNTGAVSANQIQGAGNRIQCDVFCENFCGVLGTN